MNANIMTAAISHIKNAKNSRKDGNNIAAEKHISMAKYYRKQSHDYRQVKF